MPTARHAVRWRHLDSLVAHSYTKHTDSRHTNEGLEAFFRGQGHLDRTGAEALDLLAESTNGTARLNGVDFATLDHGHKLPPCLLLAC